MHAGRNARQPRPRFLCVGNRLPRDIVDGAVQAAPGGLHVGNRSFGDARRGPVQAGGGSFHASNRRHSYARGYSHQLISSGIDTVLRSLLHSGELRQCCGGNRWGH
jgi:hypothetical protein